MKDMALVTGASSGIGAAYARLLAEKGYDLILVARRSDRLEAMCRELPEKWGISAEARPTDLSDSQQVQSLAGFIKSRPITLLVNNAGLGTLGPFAESDISKELAMLHVHIDATCVLTRAALPGMIERGRGTIINVSSSAAFSAVAGLTNYCASKAYLVSFSKCLAKEVRGTGIHVQALCPGYTRTEFHHKEDWAQFDPSGVPDHMWMAAEDVVQASFDKLTGGPVVLLVGKQQSLLRRVAKKLLRR